MSDLPIYILRQTAYVWEIEHDPIEPSFAHLFALFLQPRRIHGIENLDFLFVLESGNVRRRLWIFLHQSGLFVETRGQQGRASVMHEERVREREVAWRRGIESELMLLLQVLGGKQVSTNLPRRGGYGVQDRREWWEKLRGEQMGEP